MKRRDCNDGKRKLKMSKAILFILFQHLTRRLDFDIDTISFVLGRQITRLEVVERNGTLD
jgi:hypothetical protein